MIAPAHAIDVSEHNRYLIYHLLNREVKFSRSRTGKEHAGVVEQVLRDIFKNKVVLTIKGQLFCFDEPVAIVKVNGSIFGSVVFVYGDLGPELSDEELFGQMRDCTDFYGETVDDVLSRTRPKTFRTIEFLLGKEIPRRRTWRMKDTDKPSRAKGKAKAKAKA